MKIAKIALMFAAATLIFTGCQKEKTVEPTPTTTTTSMQKLSNDEERVQNVSDEALNDANLVLNNPPSLKSTTDLICNATVQSPVIANDSITYTVVYNGTNCAGTLTRTGQITIRHKVGENWNLPGTTVIVHLIDFHVVSLSDNHWITANGVHNYQDVTGNNVPIIIHKVWGSVHTLFDDASESTWNIARQHSLSGALGSLVLTVDGFGSAGGFDNLVDWGVTKDGAVFYSQIQQVITIKQACNWKPCSGIKFHTIPAESKSATVTFGFDDNNQPIDSTQCPTKYKLDWVFGANSGTMFLQLPW